MNQILRLSLFLLGYITIVACQYEESKQLELWYDRPASNWNEALPIGNGRIAAMVYGGTVQELYDLNEETIFTGSPYNNSNPKALAHLDEIRNLVFDNKSDSAQKLAESCIMADKSLGRGACYQPAGALRITFGKRGVARNYRRALSLDSAIVYSSYIIDGVRYTSECFTSLKDSLMAIRIRASKDKALNCHIALSYPIDTLVTFTTGRDMITMHGRTLDIDSVIPGKVRFAVKTKVMTTGGRMRSEGNGIKVEDARELVVFLSMATNFKKYNDITGNADEKASARLASYTKGYDVLRQRHIAAYQEQYRRATLHIDSEDMNRFPTDWRRATLSRNKDLGLIELLFQYGRYLLISSSQPGCQPANLQGKWNKDINPAWGGRYTLNINTEMNYWPADVTNLSELNEPLRRMTKELAKHGTETAHEMYGCKGWVAHHNTDLWRMTGSINNPKYGAWPMAGAWLCDMLWQQYLFNGDKNILRESYDIMKGAALFFMDYLVRDPRNGYLVACPSISPENGPMHNRKVHVYAGVAMDNEMLYSLFTNTAKAATILGIDKDFSDRCMYFSTQLMPMKIGKKGQLQEWDEDWDSPRDAHRHVSHLWGLYPGSIISPYKTPKEFAAARKSLQWRRDYATGWSIAWKICLWARLQDGNHANKLVRNMFNPIASDNNTAYGDGGVYPNLLCAHPPFQIDGNLGFTSGIAEMLVQSYDGFIHLLPALPDEWKSGRVTGLKMRGGFVLKEMVWENNELKKATILSKNGGILRIRCHKDKRIRDIKTSPGKMITIQ